jgi:hypothetical protein
MSVQERVIEEIKLLPVAAVLEIEKYVAFLKFRSRQAYTPEFSDEQLAAWREEFDEEDRELVETGLADYTAGLAREDTL